MATTPGLRQLLTKWLQTHSPDFTMCDGWSNADGMIYYQPLGYSHALVYDDYVKFLADDLIVQAANPKFMQLISSKLHAAELGYKRASDSRK